ncbi:MAG TPA: hypothetical protein VIM11_14440 [Tepidisphaeraceae bacterium]|jgi:hypothetical protein
MSIVFSATFVIVLPPVRLNSQPSLQAAEINDVPSHRNLPSKMVTIQLTATQQVPQLFFGIRGRVAHLTSERYQSAAVVTFAGHGLHDVERLLGFQPKAPSLPSPGVPVEGKEGRLSVSRVPICLTRIKNFVFPTDQRENGFMGQPDHIIPGSQSSEKQESEDTLKLEVLRAIAVEAFAAIDRGEYVTIPAEAIGHFLNDIHAAVKANAGRSRGHTDGSRNLL